MQNMCAQNVDMHNNTCNSMSNVVLQLWFLKPTHTVRPPTTGELRVTPAQGTTESTTLGQTPKQDQTKKKNNRGKQFGKGYAMEMGLACTAR
jgi:hypothetical protein